MSVTCELFNIGGIGGGGGWENFAPFSVIDLVEGGGVAFIVTLQ